MSKLTEQTYKKIATYVIFPLGFILAIYYGYQIIDVVIISYTNGEISIVNQDATEKILLTACRIEKTKAYDDKLIFTSDDKINGLVLQTSGNEISSYKPIINGTELKPSQCSVLTSNLTRNKLISSDNMWIFSDVYSWSGSYMLKCDSGSEITINVKTHGCK